MSEQHVTQPTLTLTVQQPTGPVEIVTLDRVERPASFPEFLWAAIQSRRGAMWWCDLADGTSAPLYADQITVSS